MKRHLYIFLVIIGLLSAAPAQAAVPSMTWTTYRHTCLAFVGQMNVHINRLNPLIVRSSEWGFAQSIQKPAANRQAQAIFVTTTGRIRSLFPWPHEDSGSAYPKPRGATKAQWENWRMAVTILAWGAGDEWNKAVDSARRGHPHAAVVHYKRMLVQMRGFSRLKVLAFG